MYYLEPYWRLSEAANTRRSACQYHIAWLQGHKPRYIMQQCNITVIGTKDFKEKIIISVICEGKTLIYFLHGKTVIIAMMGLTWR